MLGTLILIGIGAGMARELIKAYYLEKEQEQNMIEQRNMAIIELLDGCNECECGTCPVKLARDILEENIDNLPVIIDYINQNACEHIHLQMTGIYPLLNKL